MADIVIEQALYQREDGANPRLLARSPGFSDEWFAEAEEMILGFGERPVGIKFTSAVFGQPLGNDQVAVVQVTDQNKGRPDLRFHFLAIPRLAYERLYGDPFVLARRWFPAGGPAELATLVVPAEPLPPRTVLEIQRVLKRIKAGALPEDRDPEEEPEYTPENSESPALLGGVQVLVDGGRVVFERPEADTGLVPDLWSLLPLSTRNRLWPASFAFGNSLGFDALVVSRAQGEDFEGYTREEQAAEYPAGQYEYNLQVAVEHGDQQALDALLSRRSWAETWKLGLILLAVVMVLAIAGRMLDVFAPPPIPRAPEVKEKNVKQVEKP